MILGIQNRNELCEFVENGEDALEKVKDAIYSNQPYKYGLILMDCNMPIMDGYELSENIREFYRTNKISQPMIMACTGHIEEQYI